MSDIKYIKTKAHDSIAQIRQDAESFLGADVAARYERISEGIIKTKGYFIEGVQEEIREEKLMAEKLLEFFVTMLTMMENASIIFDETDQAYSQTKVD